MKEKKVKEILTDEIIINENKLHWIILVKPIPFLLIITIYFANVGPLVMLYFIWFYYCPFIIFSKIVLCLFFKLILTNKRIINELPRGKPRGIIRKVCE